MPHLALASINDAAIVCESPCAAILIGQSEIEATPLALVSRMPTIRIALLLNLKSLALTHADTGGSHLLEYHVWKTFPQGNHLLGGTGPPAP